MGSLGGLVEGSAFKAPLWVDLEKPPGHTSQSKVYGLSNWWHGYANLSFMVFSPNLVWLIMAWALYVFIPYDMTAAKVWSWSWVSTRLYTYVILVAVYYGFWDVVLYVKGFSSRKFNPKSNPSLSRMVHNWWYSLLGAVQLTLWECAFIHCYASGKLPYISDAQLYSSTYHGVTTLLWVAFVPLWREFHFYFAHRLLHVRFLYKYVHSLHHRNTDIEPFSGLTMHPIEHLYYFSCVAIPTLFINGSPFVFTWNAVHVLISPAASHSGWEDAWQSDQFHYMHHAKFECNYGTNGTPLDKWFGTYREQLGKSREYRGEATHTESRQSPAVAPKFLSGRLGLDVLIPPSVPYGIYHAFSAYLALLAVVTVSGYVSPAQLPSVFTWGGFASNIALQLAVGPMLVGLVLLSLSGDRYSFRWPFHKEQFIGVFGFHILFGYLFCVWPVYATMNLLLA